MSKIRLDRFISNQLLIPRSKVTALVKSGKIKVNGAAVKSPSFSLCPESDTVLFEDKPVEYKKYVYFILNKPKGVLSASTDKSRKTVIDLIPEDKRRPDLAPVGRLDKDTTGLLIITDDGAFSHECIHPKKMIPKTYLAVLDGELSDADALRLEQGITLADGTKCLPAKIEKLTDNNILITVFEGKYHQIKRMFGVVGLGVNELSRKSIGLLKLPKNMSTGEVKEVNLDYLLKNVINYQQNNG